LATTFPKNVGEREGGEVADIQKKGRKNFPLHKSVKLRVKKILPDKFLFKTCVKPLFLDQYL
jgi:hypothetical protein